MTTNNGVLGTFREITAGTLLVQSQTPYVEFTAGIASYELIGLKSRVAETGKVREILDSQLNRMDAVFRKLK